MKRKDIVKTNVGWVRVEYTRIRDDEEVEEYGWQIRMPITGNTVANTVWFSTVEEAQQDVASFAAGMRQARIEAVAIAEEEEYA